LEYKATKYIKVVRPNQTVDKLWKHTFEHFFSV